MPVIQNFSPATNFREGQPLLAASVTLPPPPKGRRLLKKDFAASLARLPGVEFAYRYLELPCGSDSDTGTALATVGPGFEPPLFQSLGCFYKHHVVRGVCPDRCPRNWSATLSDRARRYRVVVEDCVTTLFRIEKEKGRSP